MNDFTLVVAVDKKHLRQLSITYPTWARHKRSLLKRPALVIFDRYQVAPSDILSVFQRCDYPHRGGVQTLPWPPAGIEYPAGNTKWDNEQRYKMLAAFVHATATAVRTPYWLKLDTDVVATENDDWINPEWFADNPAIVSQPWSFTRPADQMLKLDAWVANYPQLSIVQQFPPLNLMPNPGWERVRHRRIISWCAFFHTGFTRTCSEYANKTCGCCKLPVPSQDGYMWYLATRLGMIVRRVQMKKLGWYQWSSEFNIRSHARMALAKPIEYSYPLGDSSTS